MIDEVVNLVNPGSKDVCELSKDEFLEVLIKLNKRLRNLDESENVFYDHMQTNSGWVAPTKEVKEKILEYLLCNLKKIQDKKARATIVYYMLLDLHMFSDGNGRTSRFMYDLISGDLSEKNISYYFHKDSGVVKDQEGNLEASKGIMDISMVNQVTEYFMPEQVDFIPEDILKKYWWIKTNGDPCGEFVTPNILPKSVLSELSKEEIMDLDTILTDTIGFVGLTLTPSGIAMLYVANKKGLLEKWIDINSEKLSQGIGRPGALIFRIYKNPEMIEDWNADDFREIIRIGNEVKYNKLKCLIDIFVEPEKYIDPVTEGTFKDSILNFSGRNEKLEDAYAWYYSWREKHKESLENMSLDKTDDEISDKGQREQAEARLRDLLEKFRNNMKKLKKILQYRRIVKGKVPKKEKEKEL